MPAHVPRIGRPCSACSVIAGSRPSRSIAFVIVVLSPPGITSPSRSTSPCGVRTSTGSAPSEASISACAAKSPWLASTPMRNRVGPPLSGGNAPEGATKGVLGPALLQQLALGREPRDIVAAHGLTKLDRGAGDALRILEVGRCLDDSPGATVGILRLEDPGTDEVALGAQLHHERRVGRRRDAAGAEQRHGKPARLGDLAHNLHRRAELLGLGAELLAFRRAETLDAAPDSAQVPNRL